MLKLNIYIINLCFVLALFGCAETLETRGFFPESEKINKLKAGKSTKDDVVRAIGFPSSVTAFDDNTWIYIESKFKTSAFFDPKQIESKVLEVTFTDKNKIKNIRNYAVTDAENASYSREKTPTYGHSINPVQQMIGNVGKFNKAQQ